MDKNKEKPIQDLIFEIRGQKVMIDCDLAQLYEVPTYRLNEAVKRNIKRFPEDFMFQLTENEWEFLRSQIKTKNIHSGLRSQIAISNDNRGGRRYAPFAFTEQGVSMLSSVINSEHAININISIMRAFVKLRHYMALRSGSSEKVAELHKLLMLHIENSENKFSEHDKSIRNIANALNNLIEKPKTTKKIGF